MKNVGVVTFSSARSCFNQLRKNICVDLQCFQCSVAGRPVGVGSLVVRPGESVSFIKMILGWLRPPPLDPSPLEKGVRTQNTCSKKRNMYPEHILSNSGPFQKISNFSILFYFFGLPPLLTQGHARVPPPLPPTHTAAPKKPKS